MSGRVALFLKTLNAIDVCLTRTRDNVGQEKVHCRTPYKDIISAMPYNRVWVGVGGGKMLGNRFAISP